jgi:hypothetical protein
MRLLKEIFMTKKVFYVAIVAIAIVALLGVSRPGHTARKPAAAAIPMNATDIAGVVTSSKGPEAGVWVIAETKDLGTGYRKIVVTDDQGRYLVPDLPKANYTVWVRGYGLVDSPKVQATPGKPLDLKAVIAPSPKEAAEYYPAAYWYSLLHIPPTSDFPGTGPNGNGISERMRDQGEWLEYTKTDGCEACHQLGEKSTREIPASLGALDSSVAAWDKRIQAGQVGSLMSSRATLMGRKRVLAMYADWTDRIKAGELPPVPPRPQGLERNVVVTEWDWAGPKDYFHDEISVDRRNPNSNPNGLVYGVHEQSTDLLTILDPVKNTMTQIPIPVKPGTPQGEPEEVLEPSPYWGTEPISTAKATAHSLMMDSQGRIWTASAVRERANPAFCKQGSSHPSAIAFPIKESSRQANFYDPKTKQWTLIDMCASSQHLMFAEDANNTLWFSDPGGDKVGWLNTKMYDETHDEQKSQGWTPLILDTNGNGKRDAYTEPGQPSDPTKDTRIKVGFYGINPSPVDGSVWGTVLGFPGAIVRLNPGPDPSKTALAEIYELPWNNPKAAVQGFSPRGMDIDRNGVVWTVLASGHFASFDRRKCKGPLNGPTATGQHCPEGWTLYRTPGPSFKGVDERIGSADTNYYNWVDQFDTFGMGKNVPIATGNGTDSLEVLNPATGKFVVMRVPYPLGFFAKSLDGRIDDPKAGWKGRGLWSTYATRAPWHMEGGKGTTSKAVKFQMRPDPLAN